MVGQLAFVYGYYIMIITIVCGYIEMYIYMCSKTQFKFKIYNLMCIVNDNVTRYLMYDHTTP